MLELPGDAINKIVGVVLEKIIGACWESGKTLLSRPTSTERELESLKAALLITMVTNYLDGPLAALRNFFERHPHLVTKHTANGVFVRRWVMDPYLHAFGSVPGMWTPEKFDRLRLDVAALQA